MEGLSKFDVSKSSADLGSILTVFQNERRRRKLLGGSEACTPVNFFFFHSLKSPESFSQDIGQILTWKVFFFMKNLFICENSDRFS